MADYPDIANFIHARLRAQFPDDQRSKTPLDDMLAGVIERNAAAACAAMVVAHLLYVTARMEMRVVNKVVVWKNLEGSSPVFGKGWPAGVFDSHIHIQAAIRQSVGPYVNRVENSYSGMVRIPPGHLLKGEGSYSSEIHDWSVGSNPFSVIDGAFKKIGDTEYQLKPNPLRPFRGREIEWSDDDTQVHT